MENLTEILNAIVLQSVYCTQLTNIRFKKANQINNVYLDLQKLHECLGTFLEKMFCNENPIVDANALVSPIRSKDNSVNEAIITPPMIGARDK